MKYERIERERRFLLGSMPADLDVRGGFRRIRDRYLEGTHLRLREVRGPEGETVQRKFTQKRSTDSPLETRITTFYLEAPEFALLERLPAHTLEKHRHPYPCDGRRYVVDCFVAPLEGLILAEVGADSLAELEAIEPPAFARCEVTDDVAFTGGALVRSTPGDVLARVRRLLAT